MPQPAIVRPLRETHLRDELRLDPVNTFPRQAVPNERRIVLLQRCQPLFQLSQRFRSESRPPLARGERFAERGAAADVFPEPRASFRAERAAALPPPPCLGVVLREDEDVRDGQRGHPHPHDDTRLGVRPAGQVELGLAARELGQGWKVSPSVRIESKQTFTLAEIQGKHHGMVVEPNERNAPAYREFWENLNRGQYQAAEYRRIAKGGREIWIQASYNPILDLNGKPFKVVMTAYMRKLLAILNTMVKNKELWRTA